MAFARVLVLFHLASAVAAAQMALPPGFPVREVRSSTITDTTLLNRPIGGELALDGSVVVADLGDARVHVFAPNGRLLFSVGRRGGGPGEFAAPTRAVLTKSGEVIVYDQANRQFSRFSPSGVFIERKVLDTDFRTIDNIIALPDGSIAVAGVSNDPRFMNAAIHIFDSRFSHVRSFGVLPAYSSVEALWRVGTGSISLLADGNILFTRRAPFQLYILTPQGNTVSTIVPKVSSIATLDEAIVVHTEDSRTTMATSATANLPTRAFGLPGGALLTGRVSSGSRVWDVVDAKGNVTWSGKAPGDLITQVIGVDTLRGLMWVLGVKNDVPSLYRIEVAR
jgi:hypothetical protein